MDKDYKAERKPIWDHLGKNKTKPILAQKFKCKTILVYKLVQKASSAYIFPLAILIAPVSATPTLVSQKFKLNLPDG